MAIITQQRSFPHSHGASAAERFAAAAEALAAPARSLGRGVWKARQIALVLFAYFAYFAVRGFTEGSHDQAVANAGSIVGIEKRFGFFWEPSIQAQVMHHHWIITAANWMYIWGHWPLIASVAVWLLIRRPAAYAMFRNAFFISGAIGIIIFVVFPVAPPRLADVGVMDTVTMYSHSYRVLQPPAFVNQYAAVPSLHFGWDLLIGIALVREASWRVFKVMGVIIPMLMVSAIVVTANHYIFDALAGGTVALTGLALAYALQRYGGRVVAAAPATRRVVFGESAFAR
jgi:hypothetical protein